jgi:hypothetical protein
MAGALISLCEGAPAEIWAEGRQWYPRARAIAEDLGERYGRAPEVVAGVIAALSPRQRWSENVRRAERALAGHGAGGLGDSERKVAAILGGAAPAEVVCGPKTSAFRALIVDPSHPSEVCVDTWALRAAGWPVDTVTPRQYETVAEAYRIAARHFGELPSAVQATAWILARGRAQ